MPWKNKNRLLHFCRYLAALLVPVTLAGCAGKPWTDPLEGDRFNETSQLMDTLAANTDACGKSLEGDLSLVYNNALEKKALAGYLEFMMPASYKFVIANPFGQPVFAVAGDNSSFQSINVAERKYTAGSMRSFSIRHNLPLDIISERWGEWILARNTRSSQTISAIHEDRQARGVWVTYRHEKNEPAGQTHLLVDPLKGVLLSRILENGQGKAVAEVTYDGWTDDGKCLQPQEVSITGLEYGTDIHLKFTNVRITNEEKKFRLPVPPGYIKQLMP